MQIDVDNFGPGDATDARVTVELPECVAEPVDTCDGDGGPPWTWTIGDLAAGDAASCELTADASACAGEGELTSTAEVSSQAQEDPDPDNDTASAVFEIEPEPEPGADLSLSQEVTVNPDTVAPPAATGGSQTPRAGSANAPPQASANGSVPVAFALAVSNAGPSDATGVEVTNQIPECVEFESDDCEGTLDGDTWTWEIGELAADASVGCTLTVEAAPCSGPQTATAQVTAEQGDPNVEDNTAEAVFDIDGVPALPALALLLLVVLLSLAAVRALRRIDRQPG